MYQPAEIIVTTVGLLLDNLATEVYTEIGSLGAIKSEPLLFSEALGGFFRHN